MHIDSIAATMIKAACSGSRRMSMRFAVPMLLALVLSACGKSSQLEWTEDVKLPDGRVITLSRWVEFKGGSSHPGEASTESRQRFEFKLPDSGEVVKWQSDMEHGLLKTVAVWIEGGRPLLLTEPAYGGDSIKFSCPNPPYLLYEYASGQWRTKPLSKIQIKRIRANLTMHPLERRVEIEQNRRHLSIAETSDSHIYLEGVHPVPYIIGFEGMPEQTFVKYENCDRPFNYLISPEGK
jgi:hypothetical protein